jgi:pimeloyl-ACP methyl ester carboxylesterase
MVLGQKKPVQAKAPATCSGAWTGSITFSRTQLVTDTQVTPRVSGRGKDTKKMEMKLDYKASVAVIESPERNGSSIGKASINSNYTITETTKAEEENSCDKGKSFRTMTGNFTSQSGISGSGNGEANVTIGVNSDGTYTVGVGVPQIPGKTTGLETGTYSGQCSTKEGFNRTMPSTPTNVQGASFRSNGTHRVDPANPNKLSGSHSETALGITNTITWSLQKCGGELRLSDLKFEDMKFPNWNDWQEISEQKGTIDGNLVKITAKVLNTSGETKYADLSFKETFKGDKWDGARPDMPLKSDFVSFKVEPGEEREIEFVWDSSGYAWYDDGRPRLVERIKAEIWKENKLVDSMTKNLKVAPKPVVLVHGLWDNWRRFEVWQNILTIMHSYDWKAFPVGEKPEHGVMDMGEFGSPKPGKTLTENAAALKSYISYAQQDRNAWHVDILAHSTGGLVARNYVSQLMPEPSQDGRPQVSHLLLLGTPNTGSTCADMMYIVTGNQPLYYATRLFAVEFNRVNSTRKGVRFSALAGNPMPFMCNAVTPNDTFVSVASAHWTIKDTAVIPYTHEELTGDKGLAHFVNDRPTKGIPIFTDFVKPRLAIGPRGDHNPDFSDLLDKKAGQNYQQNTGVMFMKASFGSEPRAVATGLNSAADFRPDFAKRVKLAAKQSIEVEISIEQAQNFGLTFMANAQISATLFNDKGEVVGKNLTKTREANARFRSIFYDKPTTKTTWKLKLENTSDKEFEAVLATWKDAMK